MSNKTTNYSNNNDKKKSKKRIALIVLLLAVPILLFAGIIAAYYSDTVSDTGSVTTGTLKISGAYQFFLNGEPTELNDIKNLNPGDVIVVKCAVSNTGNKSAWIRDSITFDTDNTLLPYLEVYAGEFSQAALKSQSNADYLLPLISGGTAVSNNMVINGSGEHAETESGGSFEYIGASSYNAVYTIYFLPSAGNETQGTTFGVSVSVQALQFRNNNTGEPDETAWATVRAVQ